MMFDQLMAVSPRKGTFENFAIIPQYPGRTLALILIDRLAVLTL